MSLARITTLVTGLVTAAALLVAAPAAADPVTAPPAPGAPGAPGEKATWTPADKHGFGTARTAGSEVWFTLRPGELSEIYYPDLGTPALRNVEFVVTDGAGFVERTGAARSTTRVPDARVPAYEQVDTSPTDRWRMVRRYVTDPVRDVVLVDVAFESLDGRPYRVHAIVDPALSNSGDDDRAAADGRALTAWDEAAALAVTADTGLAEATAGFLGTSDPRTDLLADGRLDATYAEAATGNVVLGARLAGVTGIGAERAALLALGFGSDPAAATAAAQGSLRTGFAAVADAYAAGWHAYVDGLNGVPGSASAVADAYWASVVVNAASEDKRNPGAFIASPSMPWVWGQEVPDLSSPSKAYHLVWSRDLYQHATALIAAGDRAAADRALDFLLFRQQLPDGSFPQNSDVEGNRVWESLQLDEVALPLVLAWQLDRTDPASYERVARSADFLVGYSGEQPAPWSPQERWENQSGYSPGTIAAAVAGLVCAADLAERVGDTASATRWLATAREWAARVDEWTVTTTGPLAAEPYYLRLTKDGDPNAATTYNVGDGGATFDQRAVVDPSFLELLRLGVKPADDPVIRKTVEVVDRELGVDTPNGRFWHRFTDDGYGEDATGGPWRINEENSQLTIGRVWPIFAGERGEYELLAGTGDPQARLHAMAAAANDGLMIAEQVWGDHPPSGQQGFPTGEGTFSATPLTWSHAQLVRLAWSIDAGKPVERPAVVACEFLGEDC
ncbi:glycoside hydrolase family 15 protein [Pseudonocardia nigra]|uniref:glycoside hydrolase family 15 protein n=1 Tax=Pseudonocardia nigra TaxID=1921578 RepID=UPI001C5DEE4A|nr:glycoside hydrolase family 15 protein [Pseudonocardia nigra]